MEKRRHKRVNVNLPVTMRIGGRLIPATGVNVSCGGIYLKTDDQDISVNNAVEITFDLNDLAKDVSLSGSVARIDEKTKGGVGVQFGNYFSNSHKLLREYLRRQTNP